MDELPFDLEPGEALIVTEETPIVPDNRSPAPGRFWLTTQRIAARWTEGGGLLRAAAPRTLTLRLTDVTETRAPGGPLVQVIARDGTRLSLQSFRVLSLRQQIAEAVAEASKAPQATPCLYARCKRGNNPFLSNPHNTRRTVQIHGSGFRPAPVPALQQQSRDGEPLLPALRSPAARSGCLLPSLRSGLPCPPSLLRALRRNSDHL